MDTLSDDSNEFDSVLISFNFEYQSHFNPLEEPIYLEVIKKISDITTENAIITKEMVFTRNHIEFLEAVIGHFLQKDIDASNRYFSSIASSL